MENRQILSRRDSVAMFIAAGLGVGFGYLSILAGYGWLIAAGPYLVLVIPLVVTFLADQRKLLVWQACILSLVLYVLAYDSRLGWMGWSVTLKVAFVFWAIGTIFSSPVPASIFLRRFRGRSKYVAVTAAILFLAALWTVVWRATR